MVNHGTSRGSTLKGRATKASAAGRPKLRRRRARYEVKFRPPAVALSEEEFLIPLVHTDSRQLRALTKILNGSSFYVKVLDPDPQSIPGGYMLMAKLKARKPSGDQPEDRPAYKAVGKVTGRILGEVEGIQVTANLQRAKREGKDRIWIRIRQSGVKHWRVSEALSYARAVDVQFERSR